MTIPCLTLTEPWAALVVIGAKHIETRSWSTKYRGPLAIHAAKRWNADDRELCNQPPFSRHLRAAEGIKLKGWQRQWIGGEMVDPDSLPRGAVLGIVNLTDCQQISVRLGDRQRCLNPLLLSAEELAFGDYNHGRYAWQFGEIYRFAIPIPAKGALGIWQWEPPDALWLPEWAA